MKFVLGEAHWSFIFNLIPRVLLLVEQTGNYSDCSEMKNKRTEESGLQCHVKPMNKKLPKQGNR